MSNTFIPADPTSKEEVIAGVINDFDSLVKFIPREYYYKYSGDFISSQSPFGDINKDDFEFGDQTNAGAMKTLGQYIVPHFYSNNSASPNYATYISFTCPVQSNGSSWDTIERRDDDSRRNYSFPMWLILMWAFHVYCSLKKRAFDDDTAKALKLLYEDSFNQHVGISQEKVDQMAENLVSVFFIRCNGNSSMPEKVRVSVIAEGFKKFIHAFSIKDLTQNEQNHRNALIKAYDRLAISVAPSLNYECADIVCEDVIADFGVIVSGIYGFLPSVSENIHINREISFKQKYAFWGTWA